MADPEALHFTFPASYNSRALQYNPIQLLSRLMGSSVDESFIDLSSCFGKLSKDKESITAVEVVTTAQSMRSERVLLLKRVAAELVGTFLLIFASAGTSIVNTETKGNLTYMGVGMSAGLAVTVVILSLGHISGAHVNPAVTFAFAAIKHFPWREVPLYVAAQIGGSLCASYTLKVVLEPSYIIVSGGSSSSGTVTTPPQPGIPSSSTMPPHLNVAAAAAAVVMGDIHHSADHITIGGIGGVTVPAAGSELQALLMEFIITFILMFVVTSVSTDTRAVGELAGIAVGATVVMNNLLAGAISGASMNPVRSLGPAIVNKDFRGMWVYIVGPHLGALVGAATYTLLRLNDQADGPPPVRSSSSFRKYQN